MRLFYSAYIIIKNLQLIRSGLISILAYLLKNLFIVVKIAAKVFLKIILSKTFKKIITVYLYAAICIYLVGSLFIVYLIFSESNCYSL